MKKDRNNLDHIETVSTIVVNIGTIISWLFSIFTFFVLVSQPKPISLPGILELSISYKVLFLTSIFLGYIQLLMRFWENSKKTKSHVEGSLGGYLYTSIVKFKRPLVVLGFVIILGILMIVLFEANVWVTSIACCFSGFIGFSIVFGVLQEYPQLLKQVIRKYDDDIRRTWLKRVKNQLYKDGYAHTDNFLNLSDDFNEINWAIKTYFSNYEFEQDLIFSQQSIEKDSYTYEICEIRFKHVPSPSPQK